MDFPPKDRGLLIIAGAVVAVAAGVILALVLRGKPHAPIPPPGPVGLVVKSADSGKLDPKKSLHCFVGGQLIGDLTLADCARKNGVAAGALDVGIDANGQLGAATEAGTALIPLPPDTALPVSAAPAPQAPAAPQAVAPEPTPTAQRAATAICWRYDNNAWTRVGDQTLNGCVQTLYAGRCERAGNASYGRWGDQTLRLIPRRVEISSDNRSFRSLVDQAADCSLAAVS